MIGNENRKILVVIGTGRSGTCWLGDILAHHPQITGYVEPKPLFTWVTEAALNAEYESELSPKIIKEYEKLFRVVSPNHLADKSHPCIWIAERIADRFPNCYFIGVVRECEPTVASMLRHRGVRRWCEEWYKYPVPNRFLGIHANNVDWYRKASIIERCTLRWLVHQKELYRLQGVLRDRFILVSYEKLVLDTQKTLQALQDFIGLEQAYADASPRIETLTKWQNQLTADDIRRISDTLKLNCVDAC